MSDPLLPMPSLSASKLEGGVPRHGRRAVPVRGGAQTYLCIALHLILVLAHVSLIIVITGHYEHHITAETGHAANRLSTIVTAASQTIGTVYAAILVLLTQQLALRREFLVRQTLSALHDKSSAWLGLGSSVLVLWRQIKIRTAPVRLLVVAVYLAGIFVFHITTPSLFNVVPYNVTTTIRQPTQMGRVIPLQSNLDTNDADKLFPESVYSIMEVLPLYPLLDTPGLLNSTLYDVIPIVEGAADEVTVNANQIQVDCGALPNGSISGFLSFDDGVTPDKFTNISIGNSALDVRQMAIANPSLVIVPTIADGSINGSLATFVVAATVRVLDASGTVQSLQPIVPVAIDGHHNTSILYNKMQLLACNVDVKNATVNVSAATGKLANEPFTQPEAKWHDWQLPEPSFDPLLSIVNSIPGDSPDGDQQFCVWLQNGSFPEPLQTCYNPSLFETFVQSYLAPFPAKPNLTATTGAFEELSDALSNSTVSLTDLNKVLANAFAAVYWYARNVDAARLPGQAGQPLVQSFAGEVTIPTQTLRSQLNLNAIPLYIGFAASCLLLFLSIILIGRVRPSQMHPELESTGLLQLAWLVGNEPGIAERVADTDDPTHDNLRRAGLFEVNIGGNISESLVRRNTASTLPVLKQEDVM